MAQRRQPSPSLGLLLFQSQGCRGDEGRRHVPFVRHRVAPPLATARSTSKAALLAHTARPPQQCHECSAVQKPQANSLRPTRTKASPSPSPSATSVVEAIWTSPPRRDRHPKHGHAQHQVVRGQGGLRFIRARRFLPFGIASYASVILPFLAGLTMGDGSTTLSSLRSCCMSFLGTGSPPFFP